jgi:hypothetical protein
MTTEMNANNIVGDSESNWAVERVLKLETRISKMTAQHEWEMKAKDEFAQEHYAEFERMLKQQEDDHNFSQEGIVSEHEELLGQAVAEATAGSEQTLRTMKAKMMGYASADKKKHRIVEEQKKEIAKLKVSVGGDLKSIITEGMGQKVFEAWLMNPQERRGEFFQNQQKEIKQLKEWVVQYSCGCHTFEADPETGVF